MNKVSHEALAGKTIDLGAGTPLVVNFPAAKLPILSDLHLVELGLSRKLARATMRASGGRDVGNRVLCPTDKVEAYLLANDIKPSVAASPKTVKTKLAIVKGKAPTAAEIAAANGFVVLAKDGDQ